VVRCAPHPKSVARLAVLLARRLKHTTRFGRCQSPLLKCPSCTEHYSLLSQEGGDVRLLAVRSRAKRAWQALRTKFRSGQGREFVLALLAQVHWGKGGMGTFPRVNHREQTSIRSCGIYLLTAGHASPPLLKCEHVSPAHFDGRCVRQGALISPGPSPPALRRQHAVCHRRGAFASLRPRAR
jgi:hypothetical protein